MRSSTSRGPGGSSSGSPSMPYESGVGPERARVDVEGVVQHPRRMARLVVEGGEVVVVVLDLGALDDAVAEADEDVLDLAARAGQRVQVAEVDRRRAGQRHVDSLGRQASVELRRLEPLARLLQQALELGPRDVAGLADRRRAPPGAARRCRAGSSSARPCGRGSGRAPPRARRRRARPRSRPGPPSRSSSIRSSIVSRSRAERYLADPLERDRRRRGDVERLGSLAQRDRRGRVAGDLHLGREALALGSRGPGSRPIRGRRSPRRAASGRGRSARVAGPGSRRAPRGSAARRRPRPCSPAPPSASRRPPTPARARPARRRARPRCGRSCRRCRGRRRRAGTGGRPVRR